MKLLFVCVLAWLSLAAAAPEPVTVQAAVTKIDAFYAAQKTAADSVKSMFKASFTGAVDESGDYFKGVAKYLDAMTTEQETALLPKYAAIATTLNNRLTEAKKLKPYDKELVKKACEDMSTTKMSQNCYKVTRFNHDIRDYKKAESLPPSPTAEPIVKGGLSVFMQLAKNTLAPTPAPVLIESKLSVGVPTQDQIRSALNKIKTCLQNSILAHPAKIRYFSLTGAAAGIGFTLAGGGGIIIDSQLYQVGVQLTGAMGASLSLASIGVTLETGKGWKSGTAHTNNDSVLGPGESFSHVFGLSATFPGLEVSIGGSISFSAASAGFDLFEALAPTCDGLITAGANAGIGLGISSPVNLSYMVSAALKNKILIDCGRYGRIKRAICKFSVALIGPNTFSSLFF